MQIKNKKLIRFIINPISGVGKQRIVEGLLYKHLNHDIYDYEIVYTKAPKHATELAREAVLFNYFAVIAVGGDGSVNETAQGLIDSSTFLGILPCGSGNGLARHLKISLNLEKAIQQINDPTLDVLDVGMLNENYFFNVSGLGFDGHVANVFSKEKKRGFKTYVKVVLKELINHPKTQAKLAFNGIEIPAGKFLNSFCIGSQFGNDTVVAPKALHNDGLLEVVVIDKLVWYKIPALLFYLASKKLHKSSLVKTYRTNEVRLSGDLSNLHADGEPLSIQNQQAIVSLKPGRLKILR